MSDISIVGVAGLLGALATIALGLLGLLVASVVAVGERRPRLGRRLLEYGAGPVACATVGVASTALVTLGSARDVDQFFLVIPIVGIAVGGSVAVAVRRRSRAHRRDTRLRKRSDRER
jgi:hypothetical protein